jgi:integrase
LQINGFHGFRRFYRTSLNGSTPEGLRRFWMGHAFPDTDSLYDAIARDPLVRREWRDKINNGFELPA